MVQVFLDLDFIGVDGQGSCQWVVKVAAKSTEEVSMFPSTLSAFGVKLREGNRFRLEQACPNHLLGRDDPLDTSFDRCIYEQHLARYC